VPGLINLDFADVKTIMSGMGVAMMGTGLAEGDGRAVQAAQKAVSSPLLEDGSVNGARGVIINVTGGSDLSLVEVSEASAIIQEAAHEEANIIFGAVVDPKMQGKVKITVIATGFDRISSVARMPAPSAAETPVDLQSYAAWKQDATERVAVAGGSRVPFTRRSAIDLSPMHVASPVNPEPEVAEMAAAIPGAEFEPASPLDVPAFLRRQTE
jgi:cell division protein FtsZ